MSVENGSELCLTSPQTVVRQVFFSSRSSILCMASTISRILRTRVPGFRRLLHAHVYVIVHGDLAEPQKHRRGEEQVTESVSFQQASF